MRKVQIESRIDQLILDAVTQTFRSAWTVGWTPEDRQKCKDDAYQEAQTWYLEHPDATDHEIQKTANSGAEKIRRDFRTYRKNFQRTNKPKPNIDDYSGESSDAVDPWDDIRIKGATRAHGRSTTCRLCGQHTKLGVCQTLSCPQYKKTPAVAFSAENEDMQAGGTSIPNRSNWKDVQLMGTGSIEAIDREALALRIATAPKRPLWPNEMTRRELRFFAAYIDAFSPAPLKPPPAQLEAQRVLKEKYPTLDVWKKVDEVEPDAGLESDFYEEYATKKDWAFYQKYTNDEGAHNARDRKRFQRLRATYHKQYERLFWQYYKFSMWLISHDPETGERCLQVRVSGTKVIPFSAPTGST